MALSNAKDYFVDAIKLENFMAFANTGWIKLHPITLVLGRNGIGKSTIIRALLVLKQSFGFPNLTLAGNLVDVGTFENAVHTHLWQNEMSFWFRLVHPDWPEPEEPDQAASEDEINLYNEKKGEIQAKYPNWTKKDNANISDQPIVLKLSFGLLKQTGLPTLKSVSIHGQNDNSEQLVFETKYDESERLWKFPGGDVFNNSPISKNSLEQFWEYSDFVFNESIVPTLTILNRVESKQAIYPKEWGIISTALSFFKTHINKFFRNFEYLPPLRNQAQRTYNYSDLWAQKLSSSKDIVEKINKWLISMGLATRIVSKPLSLTEGILGLYLKENNIDINLRDSGSGLAQILPILISLVSVTPDKFLIIEQPELHLHPEAQQALAAIFVDFIQNGGRLLVETHSEHIFYQLSRLLVKQNEDDKKNNYVDTTDFVLIYIDRSNTETTLQHIGISPDGALLNPPPELKHFFGYNDLLRNEMVTDLRQRIAKGMQDHFDIDDLEQLCFNLKLDEENILVGATKQSKIRGLILYCEKRGMDSILFRYCKTTVPNYSW